MEFIQVGWFIVGDEDAKFGRKQYGDTFEPMGANLSYWEARGYDAIPAFVQSTED
jgi:hypothetical protein